MYRSLLPLCLWVLPVCAWGLPEADLIKIYAILENPQGFYARHHMKGSYVKKLAYTQFAQHKGRHGSLLLVPGHQESSMDWVEWAYDMARAGFAPIYVLDHSGQGFSDRPLKDPNLTHVESFNTYVEDLRNWVQHIKSSHLVSDRLLLVSNSLGGLITAHYFSAYPKEARVFQKSVWLAPFFKLPPNVRHRWIKIKTSIFCLLGQCKRFAYRLLPFGRKSFASNPYTQSRKRFTLNVDINTRFPESETKGPSLRWVHSVLGAVQKVHRFKSMPPVPSLMLWAEHDSVVHGVATEALCLRWKRSPCTSAKVLGARHGLAFEQDPQRTAVLKAAVEFLKKN